MTEEITKANPAFDSWRAARSLGKGQRELRRGARKDLWGAAKDYRKPIVDGVPGATENYNKKVNTIADTFRGNRSELREGQKQLSKPKRLVSAGYQYPARAGAAAVGTAGAGEATRRKVKKNDNTGPFGVEVISKVNPFKAKKQVASQLKLVGEAKGAPIPKQKLKGIQISNTERDFNKAGKQARKMGPPVEAYTMRGTGLGSNWKQTVTTYNPKRSN